MEDKDKKQVRAGLQKDVTEIFDGVTVHGEIDPSSIEAAKRDLGPENPMVAASTLQSLRQQRAAEKAAPRQPAGMSRGLKVMAALAAVICIAFVVYYLRTHQAPPMVLVAALFALYVIGLLIGAIHTYKMAKKAHQMKQAEPAVE